MSSAANRQVLLASRPEGIPEARHFRVVEGPIPVPGPGQVLVRNEFLSVEPAMRGWVNAAANYSEPVPVGSVMRSITAGRVIASNDPSLPVGTPVTGMLGWQAERVLALADLGRTIEARAAIDRFLQARATSPLAARLRARARLLDPAEAKAGAADEPGPAVTHRHDP